jgi:7-keto-8-aminopelargonate synthetase-like enzyme
MQEELRERVAYARTALEGAGLPIATGDATPILVVHYDSAPIAQQVVGALRERGFFTCISTFPAVPINKPSLRFTISRHNSIADIQAMVEALLAVSAKVPGAFARTTPPPDDDARLDDLRNSA